MAVTQAQIDAYVTALLRHELTVDVEGQGRVTYKSTADMVKAMNAAKAELAAAGDRQTFASFTKD
ncbi:MAG: hypothetical protein MI920_18770 [Kiloniellales bacterium]|nr:hypothetical protein [Kiloniellales bacterium]